MVSFKDFTPPSIPNITSFGNADIFESPNSSGPWTFIDTYVISPLDFSSMQPATHSFSTRNNTIPTGGWYKVIWRNSDGVQAATPPVQNVVSDAAEYLPSASEVGKILYTRTVDDTGAYLGTFTSKTRPTLEVASETIIQAGQDVDKMIGDDIPPSMWDDAKRVVALRAAMLIELTFFPEQIASARSPYDRIKELFDEQIKALSVVIEAQEVAEGLKDSVSGAGMPSFTFPTGPGIGTARW